MKIVRFEKQHIPALCELERLCFSSPWSENAFQEECDNPLAVFLVAEDENGVAGYVGCHFVCGDGAMTNLAVHPDLRRKGIGQALLTALEDEGRKIGAEAISLEVRKSNLSAIKLYEKMGYIICGERPNFYTKPNENAILMTLEIRK